MGDQPVTKAKFEGGERGFIRGHHRSVRTGGGVNHSGE
ncbi:hypothetical protein A2U01_0107663 [Trifolium medium]|uniref:Uncharacterized protein n=1 Tax=Trifolium medium TaxID=97028 RepID=A0A392VG18_9FABA|nr:hypothetical protein [Trifolium medium]